MSSRRRLKGAPMTDGEKLEITIATLELYAARGHVTAQQCLKRIGHTQEPKRQRRRPVKSGHSAKRTQMRQNRRKPKGRTR